MDPAEEGQLAGCLGTRSGGFCELQPQSWAGAALLPSSRSCSVGSMCGLTLCDFSLFVCRWNCPLLSQKLSHAFTCYLLYFAQFF